MCSLWLRLWGLALSSAALCCSQIIDLKDSRPQTPPPPFSRLPDSVLSPLTQQTNRGWLKKSRLALLQVCWTTYCLGEHVWQRTSGLSTWLTVLEGHLAWKTGRTFLFSARSRAFVSELIDCWHFEKLVCVFWKIRQSEPHSFSCLQFCCEDMIMLLNRDKPLKSQCLSNQKEKDIHSHSSSTIQHSLWNELLL